MADCGSPRRKRCREDALGDEEELDGYSSGQDGIFPSEDETVSEYACEGEYLFPSEDMRGSFDLCANPLTMITEHSAIARLVMRVVGRIM